MNQSLTPWQCHQKKWAKGCGSEACGRAARVVLARGVIPADVLLVGEAPGISENRTGLPFDGPAGILLDELVELAAANAADHLPTFVPFRKCYTNLVGCLPRDEDGRKPAEPPDEQVKWCADRLIDLVEAVRPRLIVCVGKLSWDWLDPGYKHHIRLKRQTHFSQIMHPAAILRTPIANKEMLKRRAVVALRNAFCSLAGLGEGE